MPDKPTDKKMTFVEFVAIHSGESKEMCKNAIQKWIHSLMKNKININQLTALKYSLSEYYKYFKQNN